MSGKTKELGDELRKGVLLFGIGSTVGLVFVFARKLFPDIPEDRLAGTFVASLLWVYAFGKIDGIIYASLSAPEFAEKYNKVFAAYKEKILHVSAFATALISESGLILALFSLIRILRPDVFHSHFPITTVSILGAVSVAVGVLTHGYLFISSEQLGPTVQKNIKDLPLDAYRRIAEVLSRALISVRQ